MAVTAEKLKVVISSEGGGTAARNISKVGSAARDAAGDIGDFGGELGDAARSATTAIAPLRAAASAADKLGNELSEAGSKAVAAGGMMSAGSGGAWALSAGLTAASFAASGLKAALIGVALVAIPAIITAAAPVVGVLTGLAGAFGAILGSGFLAWSKKAGNSMKSIKKSIMPLIRAFGKQFIPLIESAVQALPKLIKNIGKAAGGMTPFVNALKALGRAAFRIIPKLVGLFVDLARQALPLLRRIGAFLARNLMPALNELMRLGKQSGRALAEIGIAAFKLIKPLGKVVGWIGRLVGALYNLGKAALGAGKDFNKTFRRVKNIIKNGIVAAVKWIKTTAIPLTKKALSVLAKRAVQGVKILRRELPPLIRKGIKAGLKWIRTKGVTFARKALRFLAKNAAKAFTTFETKILPKIKGAIKGGIKWLRTKGLPGLKRGLKFLAKKSSKGFTLFKRKVLPKIKSAIRAGIKWIRTKGVPKGKKALKYWSRQSAKGLKVLKRAIKPYLQRAFTSIKKSVKRMGNKSTNLWQLTGKKWVKTIKGAVRGIKNTVRDLGKGLRQIYNKFIRPVIRRMGKFWQKHKDEIKLITGTVLVIVSEFIRLLTKSFMRGLHVIGQMWNKWGDEILGILRFFVDSALTIIGLGLDAIAGAIKVALALWRKDWDRVWNLIIGGVKDALETIYNFFNQWSGGFLGKIKSVLTSAWDRFKSFGTDIYNTVKGGLNDIISALNSWSLQKTVDSILSGVSQSFTDLKSDIKTTMKNAAQQAVGAFNNAMPDAITIPSFTIGGDTVSWDPVKAAGHTVIPGGAWSAPSMTLGGDTINVPKLATGGFIESSGLAMLHAGEEVVQAADVDRDGGGGAGTSIYVDVDARGASDPGAVGTAVANELRSVLPR